jgi:hypothetical protein
MTTGISLVVRSSGDERTVRGLRKITEKERLSLSNHWMFPAKGYAVLSCLSACSLWREPVHCGASWFTALRTGNISVMKDPGCLDTGVSHSFVRLTTRLVQLH